jgi:hypothetical protein
MPPSYVEAEIGKIVVRGNLGQKKVSEVSISKNKLGAMVHICNPSLQEALVKRTTVQG